MDAFAENSRAAPMARDGGDKSGKQTKRSNEKDSPPRLSRQALWRLRNPTAFTAHRAVERAVRKGILKAPSHCECGCGRTGKLDGHHPDHRDLLRVIWLARACHVRHHIRLRQNGNG